MSATRTPIVERDREAALRCCEYALRNLSSSALRDVDFHAMAHSFAAYRAETLAAALAGVDDDFMTGEAHHAGYILIPSSKFAELREALHSSVPV